MGSKITIACRLLESISKVNSSLGAWELGVVIKHHSRVDGIEIRDQRLELEQDLTKIWIQDLS